jgi:isoleucyl-tRNA synthetase
MYPTYKNINWPLLEEEVLKSWKEEGVFEKSIVNRKDSPTFVFYEGPPSANGVPGIHHVMGRTMKDIFCRYKTLQGYRVDRKGGWDTHGLPVELQVEKRLGITKEDIGKTISVEDYNKACKEDVMKFKGLWDDLTERIGYWLDLDDPYVTYEKDYIESLWNLLKRLYDKGFLYKGHTIQPFSPAAGTGLSSHELNQPGTYKMVKDTTIVAQFKVKGSDNRYFLAWTTTPWTLPSNTALGVGKKIDYVLVSTFNRYTGTPIEVYLAKDLVSKHFNMDHQAEGDMSFEVGDKVLPFKILEESKGADLVGMEYEQLMPYHQPEDGDAFRVLAGDFVTTEDGTGIVHLAPSFGADDNRVAKQNGVGSLTLVDRQGRFVDGMGEFSGRYVKNYRDEDESAPGYKTVDVEIAIKLKTEDKAFKVEKYEHNYPHCWRTDKPILYYPLESWFIKTTAVKDKLVSHNNTINWKPKHVGEGRFGNWLENLVDWNLSRSRFWGTPLPIWRSENDEEICIGSIEQLSSEIEKSIEAGFMDSNPVNEEGFDLHRPYVDDIYLCSSSGAKMTRETDLIDVWFDSGAMPYAQWHYPFEGEDKFKENYPADFIAEGVDQTRGWFFTLHAIAVMLEDSVAYKNVLANGLVLDKNGLKMSKRLGNAIDPFETIDKYGADAVRWYMISNAPPWDNLKFDLDGVDEVKRKFFGTLANTYAFFTLYANIDKFTGLEDQVELDKRPELDRWVLSKLNSIMEEVEVSMNDHDPTRATRAIQEFVIEHLSNWYVRLGRRRFWKGEMSEDKLAAYQTLSTCLEKVSILMASFSPFYADRLYRDLNTMKGVKSSVHLADFPKADLNIVDKELEERMQIAQELSSMVLSLRKKEGLKVRQPLQKIMVPIMDETFEERLLKVKELVLSEVNVKELECLDKDNELLERTVKPDFRKLGPKVGKKMKQLAGAISEWKDEDINLLEEAGKVELDVDGETVEILREDVEIIFQDIPGLLVTSNGKMTVALDINLSNELREEGISREFINKVQTMRKEMGFEVTDKIKVKIDGDEEVIGALKSFNTYISNEILAVHIEQDSTIQNASELLIENQKLNIEIIKN